jgi:two-component system, sensor histidine kinase and response regulator
MSNSPTKLKVLIVDDIPSNIKILAAIIKEDYEILIATSGQKALEVIAAHEVDLILLDVIMPDMDGYEVCKILQESDKTRQIPIIFITASNSPEDEIRGLDLGAVDFITKPINPPIVKARVKTHIELCKSRLAAMAANLAKSQFIATMSHEIRTPLNGIMGLASLLQSSALSSLQLHRLQQIQNSGTALLHTLNDILDLSKIEANMMELELSVFSLDEVLKVLSDLLESRLIEKGIELEIKVSPEVPHLLIGDHGRLGQVLNNLTGNAIKFTKKGKISVHVEVAGQNQENTTLQFFVRDTGIGIPPDAITTMFDPFAQADSSTTREYGGSGLGLTICRRLLKLMGGEISVESEFGKGSTFQFQIS